MKKTRIYIQYPWKFPDSPYYKYLIENPPQGIEYLNIKRQKGAITSKRFFWFSNFLKRNIRKFLNELNLSIPNEHKSPKGNYNLIHCAHCLSKNKDKPWIADIEMIPSLNISGWNTKKGIEEVKKILLRKNCKKIIPWTEEVKKELLKLFPEVKEKAEVVYPAVPERKIKKRRNKKIRIIFVARYFDIKCGLIVLKVLEDLRKEMGIEGIVISNVPKELNKKYSKLKIFNLIPQRELFRLMEKSDIFLYPSAVDTFGFSILEAMSFGLPVVTINTPRTNSRREIIKNYENGLIFEVKEKINYYQLGKIEEKIVKRLKRNCKRLIRNKKLREKISENNLRVTKYGKFSIKERNKKLRRIYEEAIK